MALIRCHIYQTDTDIKLKMKKAFPVKSFIYLTNHHIVTSVFESKVL